MDLNDAEEHCSRFIQMKPISNITSSQLWKSTPTVVEWKQYLGISTSDGE